MSPLAIEPLGYFDQVAAGVPKVRIEPAEVRRLHGLHKEYPNGCDVRLGPGEFILDATVYLNSNTRIVGDNVDRTTIILEKNSNCHIFTNVDHAKGNKNIFIGGMRLVGNSDFQRKAGPPGNTSFACAFYFHRVYSVVADRLEFFDIRQTGLHFTECANIIALNVSGNRFGWSGLSTFRASSVFVQIKVDDAGRDTNHSAVHIDGGTGIFVDAEVSNTTGNGIMLDSTAGPLQGVSVQGSATGCKRGVSLIGSVTHPLQDIAITGKFCGNVEAGIMVSNSTDVVIYKAVATENRGFGVLFQGRAGGNRCMCVECVVRQNGTDYGRLHAAEANWILPSRDELAGFIESEINGRALRDWIGRPVPWFS